MAGERATAEQTFRQGQTKLNAEQSAIQELEAATKMLEEEYEVSEQASSKEFH